MFSLAGAKYSAGEFGHVVIQNVKNATFKVRLTQENVAGVHLPVFTHTHQDIQSIFALNKIGQGKPCHMEPL